jgi:hypothetical protein
MIFPPSFFDSMEHLPVHLPFEVKVGGPVQYRWMYPFERLDITVAVAPDIAAARKIILILWKKNWFLAPCSFRGKCLVWGVAT